ncbi:MAG: alpha/beta hydrolase [Ignavibacteriales bacterium]|nr:MAG: alpha/beta hydrolase [Ignavibacteriales bacterium]
MKKYLLITLFFCNVLINVQVNVAQGSTSYKYDYNILYSENPKEIKDSYADSLRRLDVYYPLDKKNFQTVIWFHGGGLTSGSRSIPEELLQKGISIVDVDYRLSPKVYCKEIIDDAASAIAWTFKNIAKYGGDTNKIFISGHSAGGYLVMMTGLDKKWLAKYNIDADRIAGIIPFSGQAITHFTIRKERSIPETQPVIDEFAPLYHVRKDAPPLILITGDRELELLGRYEENAYLYRMMKIAGHKETSLYELDGFNHGDMVKPACSIMLKHILK